MTTALIRTTRHAAHDEPGHPEHAARLHAIEQALAAHDWGAALVAQAARPASLEQVLAVHEQREVELVRRASQREAWLNLDTYTTHGTWNAALDAAGAAAQAVDAVLSGQAANAFALGRPPGHHANAQQSMGFCMFNNIAVAARHAQVRYGVRRIAIVDYDVHHGNGTQDVFYHDEQVLFCSMHAYGPGFYPGTGAAHETGAEAGLGTTLNVPLPFRTGDMGSQLAFDTLIAPALRRFAPELLLVSAGYDGHWADPIGPLTLSVAGYTSLTRRLMQLAEELCGGRIVLVLEGGYDLTALAACVVASLGALLGQPASLDPLGPSGAPEPDVSALVARILRAHPLLQQ